MAATTTTTTTTTGIGGPAKLTGDAAKIGGDAIVGRAALIAHTDDRWGHKTGMPRDPKFAPHAIAPDGTFLVPSGTYPIRNGYVLRVRRVGGVPTISAAYNGRPLVGYDKFGTAIIRSLFGRVLHPVNMRDRGGWTLEYIGHTDADGNDVPGTDTRNSGIRLIAPAQPDPDPDPDPDPAIVRGLTTSGAIAASPDPDPDPAA